MLSSKFPAFISQVSGGGVGISEMRDLGRLGGRAKKKCDVIYGRSLKWGYCGVPWLKSSNRELSEKYMVYGVIPYQ